jgi:PAS domain S-box-containing protein
MEYDDELLLSKLCKVSPVSIEVVDVENRELICTNEWISQHLGYTEEEFFILSRNLFERIVHPDDRMIQLGTYESLFNEPNAPFKECTIRVLRKDGTYQHIQLRIAVLKVDTHNKPKTVLAMATDVGELVNLREKLEMQLGAMDVISYKNSHELRGPVATILGLIQLIEHDHFDGSFSKEIISLLKRTVIKLDEVIHEINEHSLDNSL